MTPSVRAEQNNIVGRQINFFITPLFHANHNLKKRFVKKNFSFPASVLRRKKKSLFLKNILKFSKKGLAK